MKLINVKVAILDDEKDAVSIIGDSVLSFFSSHAISSQVDRYQEGELFLDNLKKTTYDLIFLDIEMPKYDGITLAKIVRETYPGITIIFISNREDKVFDTFVTQPFGFVRKNHFLSDITNVLNRYLIECEKKKEKLPKMLVKTEGRQLGIEMADILYIECRKHDQKIHTTKEDIVLHDTMSNIEKVTEPYGFKRVHKGFIINMRRVKTIVSDGVIMSDNSFVPINKKKVTEFKHEYLKQQQLFGPSVIV